MSDDKTTVTAIECEGMIFDGHDLNPIDEDLLMHIAQFGTYATEEECLEDNGIPRKTKVTITIEIEDIE